MLWFINQEQTSSGVHLYGSTLSAVKDCCIPLQGKQVENNVENTRKMVHSGKFNHECMTFD